MSLKGLSYEILTPIFLYLGDGPLRGLNFGRCACAEKRAFYALSCMLKRGIQMLNLGNLGYKIALPVGINLHPQGELLYPCLHPQRELLYQCLHPQQEPALPMGENLFTQGEQFCTLNWAFVPLLSIRLSA